MKGGGGGGGGGAQGWDPRAGGPAAATAAVPFHLSSGGGSLSFYSFFHFGGFHLCINYIYMHKQLYISFDRLFKAIILEVVRTCTTLLLLQW